MPYFNHSMAHSINQSTGAKENSASGRSTRSMPGSTHKSGDIYKNTDPNVADRYKLQMTQRKMLFMRSLLRAQVSQMMSCVSCYPVDGYRTLYKSYKINTATVLHDSPHVKMYEAKNTAMPNVSMTVRLYTKSQNDPNTSLHLKILRHLGRKHPYIIHSFEMFNDNENVYVFQEWATMGNLVEYMEASAPLSERRAAVWAKQIYRALDFLGDQAIAHRDLAPIHLVVQPQFGNEVWLKLTGFKQSIIYWDIQSNDVQFCQCWPVEKQKEHGPNFQPPEVYGNPDQEQFDPIQADIWSFGANIYYMLVKQYPYNVTDPYENIDEEIWHNIVKAPLTDDCKTFIYALMRGNANDRMPFDFIEGHPWMRANSMLVTQKGSVNSKHLGSGKSAKLVKQPRVIGKQDAKSASSNKSLNKSKSATKAKTSEGKSGGKSLFESLKSSSKSKVDDGAKSGSKVAASKSSTGSSTNGASTSGESGSKTSVSGGKSGGGSSQSDGNSLSGKSAGQSSLSGNSSGVSGSSASASGSSVSGSSASEGPSSSTSKNN